MRAGVVIEVDLGAILDRPMEPLKPVYFILQKLGENIEQQTIPGPCADHNHDALEREMKPAVENAVYLFPPMGDFEAGRRATF
jgi:hypothetical protein